MLNLLRKITPKFIKKLYHYALAKASAFFYRYPSDKLIVIGITGTTGKSTTTFLLSKVLESAGFRVGVASTILFKIDKKETVNDRKMTMLGRFELQKMLADMVKANCQYAIVETTSEGIEQFRHLGINYDVVVFTNLSPEHIEAHGSFAKYKQAKLKLFKKLETEKVKVIAGKKIVKTIVANLDNEHAADFLANAADAKFAYTLTNKSTDLGRIVRAENITSTAEGISFGIDRVHFAAKIFGQHNVYNLVSAITIAVSQGLSLEAMSRSMAKLTTIPGRLEFIEAGQKFKVIVDYAFEPTAMTALYDTIAKFPHKKIIHVFGGTGGGRDKARREVIGKFVGSKADLVIVTDEDPYDEDPYDIINQVAQGATQAGKKIDQDLFKILDRRQAIAKGFSLAKKDDLVLVTGKGSEQAMVVAGGKKIAWDDRQVVAEELLSLKK